MDIYTCRKISYLYLKFALRFDTLLHVNTARIFLFPSEKVKMAQTAGCQQWEMHRLIEIIQKDLVKNDFKTYSHKDTKILEIAWAFLEGAIAQYGIRSEKPEDLTEHFQCFMKIANVQREEGVEFFKWLLSLYLDAIFDPKKWENPKEIIKSIG